MSNVISQQDGQSLQPSEKCSKTCTHWSQNREIRQERSSQADLVPLKRAQILRVPRKLPQTHWTEALREITKLVMTKRKTCYVLTITLRNQKKKNKVCMGTDWHKRHPECDILIIITSQQAKVNV